MLQRLGGLIFVHSCTCSIDLAPHSRFARVLTDGVRGQISSLTFAVLLDRLGAALTLCACPHRWRTGSDQLSHFRCLCLDASRCASCCRRCFCEYVPFSSKLRRALSLF